MAAQCARVTDRRHQRSRVVRPDPRHRRKMPSRLGDLFPSRSTFFCALTKENTSPMASAGPRNWLSPPSGGHGALRNTLPSPPRNAAACRAEPQVRSAPPRADYNASCIVQTCDTAAVLARVDPDYRDYHPADLFRTEATYLDRRRGVGHPIIKFSRVAGTSLAQPVHVA